MYIKLNLTFLISILNSSWRSVLKLSNIPDIPEIRLRRKMKVINILLVYMMYDYAYLFVIILWIYKTKLFCINYLMPAPLIANRQSCYNILIEILSLIQCGSGKSISKLNEVSYCILACVHRIGGNKTYVNVIIYQSTKTTDFWVIKYTPQTVTF